MKEPGEIPAKYKVVEPPASFISPGNTASAIAGNSLMVSTAATTNIVTDPSTTTIDSSADITDSTEAINSDNILWMVNRFFNRVMHENVCVPGFTAVSSTFVNCNSHPTTAFFVPILPYLATTYDAVLKTIINFQDALKQKGD